MTIKLSSLASDLALEREGEEIVVKDWPNVGPLPGLTVTVRSTQYPPYIAARAAEMQRMAKKFDGGTIPPDELARADGRLAVEHLLVRWDGLDVEYSPEAARETMLSEEHRLMRDIVFWAATRVGRRDVEFVETEAKN